MMTFLTIMADLKGQEKMEDYENCKKFEQEKMVAKNLTKEAVRIYEWTDPITGNRCTHRINEPVALYVGKTTHRILDTNGFVHFVPSVGYFGCVLLTENKDKSEPCNW